jgi:hypothetical protein
VGSASRRKGNRVENEILKLLQAAGLDAVDMPLSGQLGGEFRDDTLIRLPTGQELRAEIKARKNGTGFRTILNWLGTADLLILKQDRTQPIVAMPLDRLVSILQQIAPLPPGFATTPANSAAPLPQLEAPPLALPPTPNPDEL